MITWLKRKLTTKKIKLESLADFSVVEFDPSKHYFVVVNARYVNIDDVLQCKAKGAGGSMTIVRSDKQ